MAGIGFALRKLTKKNNLLGLIQGYTHSALISMGPWLLTIISIACISIIGIKFTKLEDIDNFRLIIIYNFAFSLVLSGPVLLVATRYISDLIYNKNTEEAPGMMLGALTILYCTQIFIVVPFYILYVDLELQIQLASIINFFLITGIWMVSVFLSALRVYSVITKTFAIGTAISITLSIYLAEDYSIAGMLYGYSTGLAIIMFSLIARVFAEYPYNIIQPFKILKYFSRYWELALAGFIYNLAIWIDKWIMWFSPHREKLSSGMISYPNYDSAMFFAYIFIIPSMAVFVVSIETNFFENYYKFYQDIKEHVTYDKIKENQKLLIDNMVENAIKILIFQGIICFVTLMLSPRLFKFLGVNYLQMGIFRLGLLGASFHAIMSFMAIILSYFDLRREVLMIYIIFLVTNTIFTFISMKLGFIFYGFGYFLSSLITFIIAYLLTVHHLRRIPFLTFIQNNSSINSCL